MRAAGTTEAGRVRTSWSPWRAVVGFGVVSLTADMVYEGARSVTGPLLAALGASAALVGIVTGAGEATALVLRLVFGSWADRSGRYWSLTFAGYALTAICVPALAITPYVGAAGLVLACVLLLSERLGKAVRSPSKTALLAQVAGQVGLGRGFAVHKALDQTGALAGPLLVAAVTALAGAIWPALAVLAIPGALALVILVWIQRRMAYPAPDAGTMATPAERAAEEQAVGSVEASDVVGTDPLPPMQGGRPEAAVRPDRSRRARPERSRLPTAFWLFAATAGASTAGLVTFGVISFHLTREGVLSVAAVPLIYAAAMGVEAVAALGTGWLFDRINGKVLLVLPFMVAAVPVLAFANSAWIALPGVLLWGMATGLQDSTVKALVADLVPSARRATAYGVFAAVQGSAAVLGGAMAGALYQRSLPLLVILVGALQLASLVLLIATLRRR
jgi:MFS family permease